MIKRIPNSTLRNNNGKLLYEDFTLILVESFAELEVACRTKKKGITDKNWNQLWDCFSTIHSGNEKRNMEMVRVAKQVAELVLEIEPELQEKRTWCSTENSDIWCAGAIAEEHPEPCFHRKKEIKEPACGKGDGAYRLIINTDHCWYTSPEQGAIMMGAIILVLAQYSPVEIWIQQGWMGNSPLDGITLFPIHRGHLFNPATLWFWLGDSRKDSVFSYQVNHQLFNRVSSGVSSYPALPCDLYLSSMQVGGGKFNKQELANYVAQTCKSILFPKQAENLYDLPN